MLSDISTKFSALLRINSVAVICIFSSGCASWPQANPSLAQHEIKPVSIAILPVRVFVQANMDESQSIDSVSLQMQDIYTHMKQSLRLELETKGYKPLGEILIAQDPQDQIQLSKNPEYGELSSELLEEFTGLVNVIGKKRSNIKNIHTFKMGARVQDLNRILGGKADAILLLQTQAYLESSAVRTSRIAKGTVSALAIGVATLGTVIPVPQTQSHSRVKYFTALVDAHTGDILYYSALEFPGLKITNRKTVDHVLKKSYKKLPIQNPLEYPKVETMTQETLPQ